MACWPWNPGRRRPLVRDDVRRRGRDRVQGRCSYGRSACWTGYAMQRRCAAGTDGPGSQGRTRRAQGLARWGHRRAKGGEGCPSGRMGKREHKRATLRLTMHLPPCPGKRDGERRGREGQRGGRQGRPPVPDVLAKLYSRTGCNVHRAQPGSDDLIEFENDCRRGFAAGDKLPSHGSTLHSSDSLSAATACD